MFCYTLSVCHRCRYRNFVSYILAYVDGAVRSNGDPSFSRGACGVVIFRNNEIIGEYARGLGAINNNQAEYEGLLHCLLICFAAKLDVPLIFSDSQLVVQQVNRTQLCRSPELQPLLSSIWSIGAEYRFRLQHTPRTDPGIAYADQLCNLMLDKIEAEWSTIPPRKPRRRKRSLPPQGSPSS